MSGLVEAASRVLRGSERALELAAQNVANASTPGFKRSVMLFDQVAARSLLGAEAADAVADPMTDMRSGKLVDTHRPLDLALAGQGFFVVGDSERPMLVRSAQLRLDAEGALVTADGERLQQAGGGDLLLKGAAPELSRDGTVLEDGVPVARIAVVTVGPSVDLQAMGGARFSAPAGALLDVAEPEVRQGMIEASNVSLGEEMTAILAASRYAETGARLVQVYDELMGQALSGLGRGGK
jgi:flagellar basal-body rod protein FlgF